MSHFTVMVIGAEPEEQLAPFDENLETPYNPKSKWDWYELGGRWSGLIKLKEGANGNAGRGSLVMQNEAGIDQAKKGDIANFDELTTFAVLKDGEWFEKGEMGWWGRCSR